LRSSDARDYEKGKVLVAIMEGCAAGTFTLIGVWNLIGSKRRDKKWVEVEGA
jgi:hypothetical protein